MPATISSSRARQRGPRCEFRCPWPDCGRKLESPHGVDQHVREKHTKERPEICVSCGKSFARPYTLYRHLWALHGIDVRPGKGGTLKSRKRKQRYRLEHGVADSRGDNDVEDTLESESTTLPDLDTSEGVDLGPGFGSASVNGMRFVERDPRACVICHEVFADMDETFCHQHMVHNFEFHEQCPCSLCSIFPNGNEQAAAQVPTQKTPESEGLDAQDNGLMLHPPFACDASDRNVPVANPDNFVLGKNLLGSGTFGTEPGFNGRYVFVHNVAAGHAESSSAPPLSTACSFLNHSNWNGFDDGDQEWLKNAGVLLGDNGPGKFGS